MLTGAGTTGHCSIANRPTGQLHFALEGGVPAAVEDLAGMDGFDFKFRMHGRAPVPKKAGAKMVSTRQGNLVTGGGDRPPEGQIPSAISGFW